MATKTAADGIHYYTWNSRNLLTGITAAGLSASYSYDFLSRRAVKNVGPSMWSFQYAGLDLVMETQGGQVAEYTFGGYADEILNARVAGSDFMYTSDGLGSVRQILGSGGQIQNTYGYLVWGESRTITASIPNSFTFTGREDGEDGLLGYRMRLYDPAIGRLISEDPIRFAAADANFYRYVWNDPTNVLDPLGLAGLENLPDPILNVLAGTPEGVVDALETIGNLAAGWGDSLTMGITGAVSSALGDAAEIDKCSPAYALGEAAELAFELGISGGSALLKSSAKKVGADAARRAAEPFVRNLRASGMRVHHTNPLMGHPGGAPTMFPTARLPPWLHSGGWNLEVLSVAEHLAAHRRLAKAEEALGRAVNLPATLLRGILDSGRSCGCD